MVNSKVRNKQFQSFRITSTMLTAIKLSESKLFADNNTTQLIFSSPVMPVVVSEYGSHFSLSSKS